MAATQQVNSIDQLELVVDTDVHPNRTRFFEYLDEPWYSMINDENSSFTLPKHEFFKDLGGKLPPDRVASPEDLQGPMEEFGIDKCLLGPIQTIQYPIFSNDRVAHALTKATNDWLIDEFLDDDSFLGTISLTPHQPDKAAEEIDRVADHPGMVSALMGSIGIHPALGNRRYDPLFQALVDHDLPLVLHSGTGPYMVAHSDIKLALDSYTELHTLSHPMAHLIQIISLIFQGVPERYPDLKIVFQEGGLIWILMAMARMDSEYEKRRMEVPHCKKMPSEYITGSSSNIYFTSQPLPEFKDGSEVAWLVEKVNGPEKMMYSSDWPHFDFDSPDEVFGMLRPHFDDRELSNIFGGTAANVFDI